MGENGRRVLENVAVERDFYESAVVIDEEYGEAWKPSGIMAIKAGNWMRAKVLFEILSAVNGDKL